MEYISKILFIEFVTHDVKRFILEKPENYKFTPGEATLISINQPDFKDKKRPFTFTSLNRDLVLEFTIKKYPNHNGVTKKLHTLQPGDELIIREPWGTINYQGEGVFIAGGAGITPFISILRKKQAEKDLKGNSLIFSNKKEKDIIIEKEFKEMFSFNPDNLILTLTREKNNNHINERIDKQFLKKHINDYSKNFYVCGPPQFVKNITDFLQNLGANTGQIVIEK